MKELKLDLGKSGRLKNTYDHPLKIGRNENGYFIFVGDKKYGPFTNIFIDRETKETLIGYTSESTLIFTMDEKKVNIEENNMNATLLEKLNDLLGIKEIEEFKDCKLVGKANNYTIYLDPSNNFFLVSGNIKPLSEYPKFYDYDELVRHYRGKDVYVNNPTISEYAKQIKRVFIKFSDYNEFIATLTANDLSEETKLDIAAQRDIFKGLLIQARDNCHKVVNNEEDANKLLSYGYIELDFKTVEKLKKSYPEQYEILVKLVNDKATELKDACIASIKDSDNINFEELKDCINQVKITDISDASRREIGAKRPLTPGIFSSILAAAFTKLREVHPEVREDYIMAKNFKVIYPDEFEELRLIAQERMPSLYEEYFENQKQKFANMLKK